MVACVQSCDCYHLKPKQYMPTLNNDICSATLKHNTQTVGNLTRNRAKQGNFFIQHRNYTTFCCTFKFGLNSIFLLIKSST